jgi:hypothetical protein
MTKLSERITELEQRQARFAHLHPLLEAAGYAPRLFKEPEEVFWVATAIQRDPQVKTIAHTEFETLVGAVVSRDYVGAVESLGPDGIAALRTRLDFVTARC